MEDQDPRSIAFKRSSSTRKVPLIYRTFYWILMATARGSALSRSLDLSPLRRSAPLPTNILPSKGDIIRFAKHLQTEAAKDTIDDQDQTIKGRNFRQYPISEIAKDIAKEIVTVWTSLVSQFSPPIIFEFHNVQKNVRTLLEKAQITSHRLQATDKKIQKVLTESFELFDILSCRCPISLCSEQPSLGYLLCDGLCDEEAHVDCSCPDGKKIPVFALKFIKLQRLRVQNQMEEVLRLSREQRQAEEEVEALNFLDQVEDREREKIRSKELEEAFAMEDDEDVEKNGKDDDDEFLILEHKKMKEVNKTGRNMSEMPLLGFMANKFNTSPREASLLVSAALIDLGFVTAEDCSKLVDKNKVKRAMERVRERQQVQRDEALLQPGPKGLYLDSRNDKCLAKKEIRGNVSVTKENPKEEHYSIVFHPADKYQDCTFHIMVPKDAPVGVNKAQYVADLILQKCHEKNMNMDDIVVCGGDSTWSNTGVGHLGGVFLWLERFLEKNLMWSVCSIHILELTPKNLFISLDGPTASGTVYTGGIGRVIKEEVMKLDVDPNFVPLPQYDIPILPNEIVSELSSDQLYLYSIAHVVRTGVVIEEFEKYACGPLNEARWNTRWSRIFKLYISKRDQLNLSEADEENLKLMVHYLMGCYIPAWFEIRLHDHLLDAPVIFLNLMTNLQSQPDVVKTSVGKTLQTGAYSLHEETILQSMLCGDDEEDRRFAIQTIIKNREKAGHPDIGELSPQKRVNPRLQFDAKPLTLRNVIVWDARVFREPPLTCNISSRDLWSFLDTKMDFPGNFPNHTQSVERMIKRVTEAGQHVATEDRRDGVVLAQLEACRMLSVYESKKDLVKLTEYADTYRKKPRRQ